MARGTQFLVLTTMLRDELRRSSSAAVSSSDLSTLRRAINRNYEILYADYDWPILRRVFESQTISAGQNMYNFPSTLDPERVEKVVGWVSGQATPLERGIGFEQYAQFDPEDDERSSPITHWDLRSVSNSVQYEVWPLPDSTTQYVQFIGFKKFVRLVNDIDACLLDDNMVVAFAAAEILASQGADDAEAKLKAAQTLYNRLRGRTKGASKIHTFVDGGTEPRRPEVVVRVNGG